jgi:hypothetical protein
MNGSIKCPVSQASCKYTLLFYASAGKMSAGMQSVGRRRKPSARVKGQSYPLSPAAAGGEGEGEGVKAMITLTLTLSRREREKFYECSLSDNTPGMI